MDNSSARSMAADIRYGVHTHLLGLKANIDRVTTGYAHGLYHPLDNDYDHIMEELRVVSHQLEDFIAAKECAYNKQPGG